MHTALRRTGWSLVTLGACGLAAPAQGAGAVAEVNRVQLVQLTGNGMRAAENNEQTFLEEIRVELAWLGDPVTFSYGLLARCNGQALEVHGYVPDEAVRQQVLQLARAETGLPVLDALRIHPYHLARRRATEAPRQLEQAARQLLVETCGAEGRGFEVRPDPEGHVLVRGTISSYEAKLAVSRALQQLSGCTCAVNQLQIVTSERDGKTYAQVRADGKHLLAVVPNAPPLPVGSPAVVSAPGVEVARRALPAATLGGARPGTSAGADDVHRGGLLLASFAEAEVPPASVKAGPVATVDPIPTYPVMAAAGSGTSVRTLTGITPGKGKPAAPATTIAQAASTPEPDGSSPGLVLVSAEEPQPATSQGVYTTVGTVTFPSGDPAPAYRPTSAISPALLKRRVESVCARRASEVQVIPEGPNKLVIHLRVATAEEGDRLSSLILEMPELGPFQVSLQMHIGQ